MMYHYRTAAARGDRRSVAFGAFAAAAGILLCAWLACALLAPTRYVRLDIAACSHDRDFSYVCAMAIAVPWPFLVEADGTGANPSQLRLFEGSKPLGPAHAGHDVIRSEGLGRYSHWAGALFFSSSDRTDPRDNGRSYTASVRAKVDPRLAVAALGWTALLIVLFPERLARWATRLHLVKLAGSLARRLWPVLTAAVLISTLGVALGWFPRLILLADVTKDSALVMSLVAHALLGVVVAGLQCLVGAGTARWLFRNERLPLASAMLLGFPIGVVLSAAGAVSFLAHPMFGALFLGACIFLLLPLRVGPTTGILWAKGAVTTMSIAIPAAAFGIWLGLLWHGPTATVAGMPSGDAIFFSTFVTTLAVDPWPLRNWGNEGELFAPFNILWPAIGASIGTIFTLEPFAYLVAAGGAAFVVFTLVTVRAYIESRTRRLTGCGFLFLTCGILAAGRYPYWVVESPPVIYSTALTISLWYWTSKLGRVRPIAPIVLSLACTALTKVTTAVVLVPLTIGAALRGFKERSLVTRATFAGLLLATAVYSSVLLFAHGSYILTFGGLGPESYRDLFDWGYDGRHSLLYVLRDCSAVLAVVAALRLAPLWVAMPIAIGMGGFLVAPFALRAGFIPALVLLAICACERPARAWRNRFLVVAALGLGLPATLWTDPTGAITGSIWAAALAVPMTYFWYSNRRTRGKVERSTAAFPTRSIIVCTIALISMALFLFGVSLGHVALGSNFVRGEQRLAPSVYRLWREVRSGVPRDALVFTDQTGADIGLLGGWNTYAFHGARQLYVSTWYQSGELRADESKRLAKLAKNNDVLEGKIEPDAVDVKGNYTSFFAVVRRERVDNLHRWEIVRTVDDYAILRWTGKAGER